MKAVGNGLLVVLSLLLTTMVAEATVRVIDGYPLFADWLPDKIDRRIDDKDIDRIVRAPGVDRAWFFHDPPPLPNRTPVPDEWMRLQFGVEHPPDYDRLTFRPVDYLFKAWNSEFVRDPCSKAGFRGVQGRFYTYPSLDGLQVPRYRYLPNVTTPLGLVTNQIGWRGPPLEFRRAEKTVRIVFIGASTTVGNHSFPFSYPELVGNWLNVWAEARNLGVRFEALNAGRESINSTDNAAIVRTEVLPLRPDLVVYFEGANQFDLQTMVDRVVAMPAGYLDDVRTDGRLARFLSWASHRVALARRLRAALGLIAYHGRGEEWSKPSYDLVWPAGLDEHDPDLARKDLPINLSTVVSDLDRIRADLSGIGAELAVSSFPWMARDNMVLDPARHKQLIEYLNVTFFPFRYRDIERMAAFQNRVFAKYARLRDLPFVDVAAAVPLDPDLFVDAIHMTYGGVRLRGWASLQGLIPIMEKRLTAGQWPRPQPPATAPPPGLFYSAGETTVNCKAG